MDTRPTTEAVADENPWTVRVLTVGLGLALLAMGFVSWHKLSEMTRAAAKIAARDAKAIALLQAENQRLSSQTPPRISPILTAEIADSKLTLGARRVEGLDFLTDLARRGYFATPSPMTLLRQLSSAMPPNIKRVTQPAYMIDANGNFGPGFGQFFGLTENEESSLQAGLSAWQGDMERAIQAKTTVRRPDDGSVILEVNPVDNEAATRERFTTLLREGLGPERFRLFKDLNSGPRPTEENALPANFTGNLNFFGEATATYTVKRTPIGMSVKYDIKAPNGFGSGGAGSGLPTGPDAIREQLIKTYGPVMKVFPADF